MTVGYDPDRLRSRLSAIGLGHIFRVIHRDRRSTPLGAAPAPSRFSDPRERYAVLYASDAVRCAFWETLGRNCFARRRRRELPRTEVEARLVVSIASTAAFSLVVNRRLTHHRRPELTRLFPPLPPRPGAAGGDKWAMRSIPMPDAC